MFSKRLSAFMLTGLVAVSGLTGGRQQVMASAAPAAPAAAASTTIKYPLSGNVSFTVFSFASAEVAKYVKDLGDSYISKQLEKRTGVKLKYLNPPGSAAQENYNLLVAAGEVPDISMTNGDAPLPYNGGLWQGVADKVYIEITDKVQKSAPDYYKFIKGREDVYKDITDDKGRLAAFYKIKVQADPPTNRMLIRKDVRESVNEPIPILVSEYERLFGKLLAAKITPLVLNDGFDERLLGIYNLLGPSQFSIKDKKVVYGPNDPDFRNYLTLLNNWYSKGYIAKDFSLNTAQRQAKFDTKEVGIISAGTITQNYNRAEAQGFIVETLPFPRRNADDKLHWAGDAVVAVTTAISAKCKNQETAMNFLNYFYTPEGADFANWGVEGETYTIVNGKPKFTELVMNNKDVPPSITRVTHRLHIWPKISLMDVECNPDTLASPGSLAARIMYSDDKNVDRAYVMPMGVVLNEKELTERTAILADIKTYCDEMTLQFITGAIPITKISDFSSTLKKLGVDKAISLTQAAYDRYLAK